MKTIPFNKMVGAGNDFIVVESPRGQDTKKLALRMCDRTNGVGADGLLILDKSRKADIKMRIINSDGSEAEMCGNGARCLAVYVAQHKLPRKKSISMETLAGIVLGEVNGEIAKIRLSDPKDYQPSINILVNDQKMQVSYIDTGVPHTIVFVDGLDKIDVEAIGRAIRFHPRFAPRGANVNFVEQINRDTVAVRTYERGVEGETKACGTGSVAAGIVGFLKSHHGVTSLKKAKMNVVTKSGEILEVSFQLQENRIMDAWLKGSGRFVAKGEFYV